MYRPQLNAISVPLSASIHAARGIARVSRSQPRPYFQNSQPATSTVLQTMRCMMICSDGTDLSRCQYSGITPQITNAPTAIHRPRRSSGAGVTSTPPRPRSEEHTSELQSLMRSSYAVFCLKKKNTHDIHLITQVDTKTNT